VFTTSQSARLDDIETRLPSPPFLRCHRSYLVNLDYARSAEKNIRAFIMKNGDRADIRSGGFKACAAALDKWRLHKAGRDD
jgi:DNA-binding LytR/AlgR family response regulator